MKTVIVIVALSLTAMNAAAQKMKESEVPASVKESFAKKYPGAKVEQWEKEGVDYEAEFDLNKTESSAVFTTAGEFKELEQEIKISELPGAVKNYCAKNFPGHKLSEAAKIMSSNGTLMYEAEMKNSKEHFDALFDAQGGFIKKIPPAVKEDKY